MKVEIVGQVVPNPKATDCYILRDPNKMCLYNIPDMSMHGVNTERVTTHNRGMKHVVGGWPKEYDPEEPTEVAKYMKKLKKDANLGYLQATKDLSVGAKQCIVQNNEIDMFEEYFADE